jgi:CHAT domain-containing protein/anti-sigma factor RsiW
MADPIREGGQFQECAKEAFRQMREGSPHPDIDEIAGYLEGRLPEPRIAAISEHLTKCDPCRERVAEFEQFQADCEHPPAQPGEAIEEEFRKLERRVKPRKIVPMPPRWLAVAAAAVLTAGAGIVGYQWAVPSTPLLLARAYRESRGSEFRIAGAEWTAMRQQRAGISAFSLPEPLLKAQGRLGGPDRGDPDVLHLRGEAQMIANDAAEAVRTLERARDLRPDDPRILADLGAAYAMRGDATRQFGDYTAALDLLERSLRLRAGDREALFNRAVVLEKLMLYDQAAAEWKSYLRADPSGGWAQEARLRLAAIQERLRKREKALEQLHDDPGYFLSLAEIDGEAWLLSPVSTRWLLRAPGDPAARDAVDKLAGVLAARHGDAWLRDMSEGACVNTESLAALGQVLAADTQANKGDFDGALAVEERATRRFSAAGCSPGAFRARQSQIVALNLAGRTQDCLDAAHRLGDEVAQRPYIRLRARVARLGGDCATRLGRLDEAASVLHSAWTMSRNAGYLATALDIWNMDLDKTTSSGLPSRVLAGAEQALHSFWAGSYGGGLVYPTLREMMVRCGRSGQPGAALWFARAEVWATGGKETIGIWQVGARGDLAAAEQEMGEWTAARADLETATRLAAQLPALYTVTPSIALARFETVHGSAATALERLRPFDGVIAKAPWVVQAEYHTAFGQALWRSGARQEAIEVFRRSIDAGASRLSSVSSEDERSGVRKEIESAYRGLVAAQLAAPGNEEAALRSWQEFRNSEAPRNARPPASAASTLWFLELPDGYVAWFSRGERVVFHRWEAAGAGVRSLAARFARECSDTGSSSDSLRAHGMQLYEWMVAPFRNEIAADTVVFELDGALSGLPVQALISREGDYLGDRFSILIAAGRPGAPRTAPGADAKVLVIANPAIAGASASRFPPLPDTLREAEAIRASFAATTLIEGREASIDSLARQLPNTDIVHFAGHGDSDSGNGALLFAPRDPSSADYQALRAVGIRGMDWSRCALAVLSACAAAEGERHGSHNPEGLIRALTTAGVARVAASLWNVDSAASAELMTRFYGGLKAGDPPERAMQRAQAAVRRDPRWAHPAFWAGFQLYGTI